MPGLSEGDGDRRRDGRDAGQLTCSGSLRLEPCMELVGVLRLQGETRGEVLPDSFLEEIPDALDLVAHAEDYPIDYNTVRPHEALAWNRPNDVHLGLADPLIPNFPRPKICQLLDAGHCDVPHSGPFGDTVWQRR